MLALLAGVVVGKMFPDFAVRTSVFAHIFLNMVKMIIAPLLFSTLVVGIAGHGDIKNLGKLGIKTIVYFEIVIVPKRIAKIEIAIRALDVPTLLECAFTVTRSVYLDAFYFYVSCAVKGTFLVKSLVSHRAVFISSVFVHSSLSV